MNPLIQYKTTILPLVIAGVLACFSLPRGVRATDLDGVLPGGNNADGYGVLTALTTGGFNTGNGWFSLHTNAQGSYNTAVGAAALFSNTQSGNTAVGAAALLSNTIGIGNTATGLSALGNNLDGIRNTANGVYALNHNISGGGNTAIGYQALVNNTGDSNTAVGNDSLVNNTSATGNTAIGTDALASTTIGAYNTATGFDALFNNTGFSNTANGASALNSNTGNANTAMGAGALLNNTTGFSNIALGFDAGINVGTADHVICIGADGQNVSNSCYIGQIFGATSSAGTAVFINSDGKLGTTTSSRRFKEEIKPMERASEALFALKPVTFRYKKEIDSVRTSQFGLVAEDVEKVNPDLVVRDKEGKPYSVRYEQINAMLLNEFLKEHRKNEEQEATIVRQQKQIEVLTEGLQKVSAQLEVIRRAPQTALNDR